MWTLDDIDNEFPLEQYGTTFRDMYTEVHGHKPRGQRWLELTDFFADFDELAEETTGLDEDEEVDKSDLDWLDTVSLDEYSLYEEVGMKRRHTYDDDEWN